MESKTGIRNCAVPFAIATFIFVGIFVWEYRDSIFKKKWRCTESGCELVFGGKYDTKEECSNSGCPIPESFKINEKDEKENKNSYEKFESEMKKVRFNEDKNKIHKYL